MAASLDDGVHMLPTYFMRSALLAVGAALLLSNCSEGRLPHEPPHEPPPPGGTRTVAATGAVFTLDGRIPPGLRVTLDGSPRVMTTVGEGGLFAVSGEVSGDSVTLIIDVPDGQPRTTLPALFRLPAAAAQHSLRVVLVPTTWTVETGAYAGTPVDISIDAAFQPPCDRPGDTNCDGFFPIAWASGIKVWPTTSLPARLAFDHLRSHQSISAADSVRFWNIVHRMNDEAGMPLFRPARQDEVTTNAGGLPMNGVLIRVDTTLAGFGAWANWWWDASGQMYAGLVRPRTVNHMGSGSLMTHELLHTHGMKHSCSWTTVMGGYGCGSTPGLSPHDVAYFHLARRILEVQRMHSAPHGLVAALQGERVVLRNLPPFPLPGGTRPQTMGGDSITHLYGDHAH